MSTGKKIKAIKFGILSPEDIRRISVTTIITSDTYDEDGMPIEGGLMDRRLGILEPGQRCPICGNFMSECPGHFGHLELARPVVHVGFIKIIHNLLRAVCRSCGRLLINPRSMKRYLKLLKKLEENWPVLAERLNVHILKKAMKTMTCPHCGERQYKIRLEKPTTFYEERKEGIVRLTPIEVRSRLEKIPDEDVKLVGIDPDHSRPEWMILTVLPVPPIAVRPSILLESGVRAEDDLTHKLVDIVRINERLKENIEAGAPQLIIEDLWELLQYHVTTYFDNEVPGIPPAKHRSGRPLRTLAQRLKGKEGRFRGHLSGKRVDFSARTVISPDPNLSINEVGVPLDIAKILTIPERVAPWNIEELRRYVVNGPEKWPGANYIVRPDGRRVDLRFVKDRKALAETLAPGFVVERHLKDGDIVLFNRQPSLHRMSIMAHAVKVLPGRTFRLNLTVCPPYNADFDGDEMNLHVPQTEEARAEARILMLVQNQILSPRYGGPIIGGLQDYISGAYLLTSKATLLEKRLASDLLATAKYDDALPEPVILSPKVYWTGKQLISLFLPPKLNYSLKANICQKCAVCVKEQCPHDAFVVIRRGRLLAGVFDKKSIGAQVPESVLHRIIKDFGTDAARIFIDNTFRMFTCFLEYRGFTMTLDDVEVPAEATMRIREILEDAYDRVAKLIDAYKKGELEPIPGRTLEETLEMRIMEVLAEARDSAGEVAAEYLYKFNNAYIMARAGARGNILNLTQMAATLGQQSVRGQRITRGYKDRTLPHFKPGDLSAAARGFVERSFKDGLNPIEMFFHAAGGREGLVDTAVRTSQSGYMQRRLINALQDIRVEYDGTVRLTTGDIVQFAYGEDGVDPAKSDHGKPVNIDKVIERVLGHKAVI